MSFLAKGQEAVRAEIERALACFRDADAEFVDVPTLLRADVMLDIYGEDIRNRAFIVHDGVDGDFVLRPDFTVPVVEAHLERGNGLARYAYSGRVWRKKRARQSARPHSFWQVGLEIFDRERAASDAAAFGLAQDLAKPHGFAVKTGDLGLIFSLLDQIDMPIWRREALKRQFWRPRAFERLLERYSSGEGKHADLSLEIDAPAIGLRSRAMIEARIERLHADAALPPLRAEDVALLREVLELQGSLAWVETRLQELAAERAELQSAAAQFAKRNEALSARGVDLEATAFDASFGRETMEYYDGFVFGFYHGDQSVIAGGRYDHLAQSFGGGALNAVGLAYRPELFLGEGA